MKLSKAKIFIFFMVLFLLGVMLYPRGIFLGYLYEGRSELGQAERYYLQYLEKSPFSKFATLRLVSLYERMGAPEHVTPLLRNLYDHRPTDLEVATTYLDHLESKSDEDTLYHAQLQVARGLMQQAAPPKKVVQDLLEVAYQYALWQQDFPVAYDILNQLSKITKRSDVYDDELLRLNFSFKQTEQIIAALQKRIQVNPQDEDNIQNLVNVYMLDQRYPEAKQVLAAGLVQLPNSLKLWQSQIDWDDATKNYAQLITDLIQFLADQRLTGRVRWDYTGFLASAYDRLREFTKALDLYQQILAYDPSDEDNWLNVLYTLDSLKRRPQEIAFLKEYLAQFPADAERQKMLVEIYLYDLKDAQQLPLYERYVQHTHNSRIILDVASLLIEQHQDAKALIWLRQFQPYFSRHQDMLQERAQLEWRVGDKVKARLLYSQWAATAPHDVTVQISAGRELYFMNDIAAAVLCLRTAVALDPAAAEAWFWLSEIHAQSNEMVAAKADAKKIVALLQHNHQSAVAHRMWLKSRARLGWTPQLRGDYQVALQQHSKDVDLWSDWLDALMAYQQTEQARTTLAEFQQRFPQEKERLKGFELRMAFLEKRWPDAIAMLYPQVQSDPENTALHRDLGEAYLNNRQWRNALQQYTRVQNLDPQMPSVAEVLRDLHQQYDTRITPHYNFTKYGAELYNEWGVKFKTYVTENWAVLGDLKAGWFDSPVANYTGYAEYGRVSVLNQSLEHWVFQPGLSYGFSDFRKTASPSLSVQFKPHKDLSFTASAEYRTLRTDFSQAVAAGTLMDDANFEWAYSFKDRIHVTGRYRFERNYLPGGPEAFGNAIEPALTFVLVKHPYVTLGYQYSFWNYNDIQDFLLIVPLIQRINANYVTGSISGRPHPKLLLQSSGYWGNDSARDLGLASGDLFGVRGQVDWALVPWLDLLAFYEFGRQRYLEIPGYSNVVNMSLSVHW